MSHFVAVYGTLRKGLRLHRNLEGAIPHGEHTVECPYRMVDVGSFPALLPAEDNHEITFEVFEVDDNGLRRLDLVEGYPTLYHRKVQEVGGIPCNVYVFTDPEWGGKLNEIASGDYKQYLDSK